MISAIYVRHEHSAIKPHVKHTLLVARSTHRDCKRGHCRTQHHVNLCIARLGPTDVDKGLTLNVLRVTQVHRQPLPLEARKKEANLVDPPEIQVARGGDSLTNLDRDVGEHRRRQGSS